MINGILRAGESDTVEFKETFDSAVMETLCAFANTAGGSVYVGVCDDGSVRGCQVGRETLQSWINQVKQVTNPTIIPDAATHSVGGKAVVALSVAPFPIKPVACRGRYYRRVRNANHQLRVSEVVDMHLRSFNTSWDYQPCPHRGLADVSLDKVRRFLSLANRYRTEPIEDSAQGVLTKLELLRDSRISNACYLLFTSGEPSTATVELGRFQDEITVKDGARVKADLPRCRGAGAGVPRDRRRLYGHGLSGAAGEGGPEDPPEDPPEARPGRPSARGHAGQPGGDARRAGTRGRVASRHGQGVPGKAQGHRPHPPTWQRPQRKLGSGGVVGRGRDE
jgi:hypothetical protein